MESPLRKQISSIMKDHRKRQVWYRIVTSLAVVVVFITTYMLILPAITMENKAQCGITEHKHDANCYSTHYEKEKVLACTTETLGVHKHTDACYDAEHKLICGYADFVIHQHDASCYDAEGTLVCTIPEHKLHEHTENCYQMQKQLVCTQEESVGHTHTAECYTREQGDLICAQEEHTHGEGCYDAEGNLICTQEEHVHGDECYQWNDVLTCTIPESAGHQHSDVCYQDVKVLICEEPAELHTHTAECYKDGVLACGKVELKEHQHSDACFKEEPILVETLVCDRVEHVHTDECYKDNKSSKEEIESNEEASSEEISSEVSSEEVSSEEVSGEAVSEEESISVEEVSSELASEEANSEEISSEEESSEEVSTEAISTEEVSTEEITSEEASSEEESTEEISSEEASTEEFTSEAETEEESSEEESSEIELPDLTGNWSVDMMLTTQSLIGYEKSDFVKFCLEHVGVSNMKYNSDLETWIADLTEQGLYASGENFDPTPGDVIFFDKDEDGKADHIGIVTDVLVDDEYNIMQIMVAESGKKSVVEENVYQPSDERLKGHCLYLREEYRDDIDTLESFEDFLAYVTGFTGSGTKYDPSTGNYTSDLNVNFEIAKADIESKGYHYELKFPEGIIVPDDLLNEEYDLKDEQKATAGKFYFVKNSDGTYSVRIQFDSSYVKSAGDKIIGHVWFKGRLSEDKVDEKGDIVVAGKDKMTLTIPKEEITYPSDETNDYNLKITKDGQYNPETGKLEYTVVVYSTKGTPDVIDFSDVIKVTGMKLQTPEVTVTKSEVLDNKNGWVTETDKGVVSVTPTYDASTGKLTMQLPKIEVEKQEDGRIKYDKYYIKYTYDVSEMEKGTVTANNKARVESKDSKTDTTIVNEADKEISRKNEHSISKNGNYEPENGRIKWTITLNENQADIAGGVLSDDMLEALKDGNEITIVPSDGVDVKKDSNGKITSIEFVPVKNNRNTNKYTITYYTAVESSWDSVEVSNTARFQPSEGGEIGTTEKVTVGGGDVDKTMDDAQESPDGKTAEVKWTVALIVPDGRLPAGTVITDFTTKAANGESGKTNYLTADQIKKWAGAFCWENELGNSLATGNFTDSQKFEMKFVGSDGKEYSYEEAIAMSGNIVTFNMIKIKLLNELQCTGASKLKFSYSTTADLLDTSMGVNKYYNTIEVGDKKDSAAYNYYKAGIIKSDGNGQTTQTSVTNDGELTWKIKVMTDDQDCNSLTVTDKLPSGVKLTGVYIQKQSGSWPDANFTINEDGTLNGTGRFCDEFSIAESKYENDALTLVIKSKNGKKLPKELTFEIIVKCEVKDAQTVIAGTKYTFTNEASAKEDDVEIGSSSQTQEWTKKDNTVVKKVVDKSGEWNEKSHVAKYKIVLNSDEEDLVPETDILTLIDTFSCYNRTYWVDGADGNNVSVYAELIPSSVKLYYAVKDEQGNYTTGTEVSGWSWTYKNGPKPNWPNWTEHTLTVSGVPDQKALIFEYEYLIERDAPDSAKNMNVDLVNEAELSGTSYKDNCGQKTWTWKEASAGGGVTTDKNYTLYKVDKDNYGKLLSGAVFELQQYENGNYTKVNPEKHFTTNEQGVIQIKWDANVFKKNVLYKLVEIQAPNGYKIPEDAENSSQTIEFYFSDEKNSEHQLPTEIPSGAIDLTKTSHVAYIENEMTQSITLPETGGIGTYLYTVSGLLLIAGAALLMYIKFMRKGGRRVW